MDKAKIITALFAPRFSRVDFYGLFGTVAAAHSMQSLWPFVAAIPLGILSHYGTQRFWGKIAWGRPIVRYVSGTVVWQTEPPEAAK